MSESLSPTWPPTPRALLRAALEEVYVGSQEIEADAVADKLEDLGILLIGPREVA